MYQTHHRRRFWGTKNVSETLPTALLTQALTTLTNLHILHILQQELMSDKGSQ